MALNHTLRKLKKASKCLHNRNMADVSVTLDNHIWTAAELALQYEDIIKARAKERQIRKPINSVSQNSAEQIDTRQELARMAGGAILFIGKRQLGGSH